MEIGFFFRPEDTLAVIKPHTERKGIISAGALNTAERDFSSEFVHLMQLYHSGADRTAD